MERLVQEPEINLERWVVGDLDTNCYLLWSERSADLWVIDPGAGGDELSQRIVELDRQPSLIILTHAHFDHVLGLLPLHLNFPDTPIALHPADNFLLAKAQDSAQYWLKRSVDPVPAATMTLNPDTRLEFGPLTWTVLATPGHTPGSIALLHEQYTFTGDTLFANGVGRTDFSYSKPLQLSQSLKTLRDQARGSLGLPGHGEMFTIT